MGFILVIERTKIKNQCKELIVLRGAKENVIFRCVDTEKVGHSADRLVM